MKKFFKILLVVLLLLSAGAAGVYGYLYSLKPKMSGSLSMPGLQAEVEVIFDSYGIPHIYAQNESDAWYALGYLHAQERLFQMEMIRRVATGRLSEVFGSKLLEADRLFRTFGLKQYGEMSAAAAFKTGDQPYQKTAAAYLAGINHFIETGATPVEFTLAGIPKEKFSLGDFYGTVGYMAFGFAQAFRTDPLMTKIHEKLGKNYFNDLAQYGSVNPFPGSLKIPTSRDSAKDEKMEQLAQQVNHLVNQLIPVAPLHGSNAWVISPEMSASGKVLFANDTHIGFGQPAVWYEAHIECPGFSFYGNYLAGLPFAPLGHNRQAAWGLTMFENDDIDFYREKVNPDNLNQVWATDHWEEMTTRTEVIKVKDSSDVTITVRSSWHGPIVNDVLTGIGADNKEPVAMWWALQKQPSTILQGAYLLAHATNVEQAQKAASFMDSPGLNIMYGDAQGNIAWWAAAHLVKRPAHVNPVLLLNGADGKDEPLGWYDFSSNPHALNPEQGYIYSANNQPERVENSYYPGYYLSDARAQRITALLSGKKDWDMTALKKMVNDVQSPVAPVIAREVAALLRPSAGNGANMADLLQKWDGNHAPDAVAPVIYYKLLYHLTHDLFADELGEKDYEVLLSTYSMYASLPGLVKNDSSVWWDNVQTGQVKENRQQIFTAAFEKTLADLEKQLGKNVDEWQWKKVHLLEHKHPLSEQPPLDKIFNVGTFSVPGGQEVINNQSFALNKEGIYRVSDGPAMRILIDFADIENSVSVLPTGQSGYFMSKHYDDQAEMYNTGGFRKQMMNRKEIENTAAGKLILEPLPFSF